MTFWDKFKAATVSSRWKRGSFRQRRTPRFALSFCWLVKTLKQPLTVLAILLPYEYREL